jgi:hypothetical protein
MRLIAALVLGGLAAAVASAWGQGPARKAAVIRNDFEGPISPPS